MPDQLRTGIGDPCRYEPLLQRTYNEWAQHDNTAVIPARPAKARDKGSVEDLVGLVKGSFFKQRRFLDREDRDRQLREWLVEVNAVRPSRATRVGHDRSRNR